MTLALSLSTGSSFSPLDDAMLLTPTVVLWSVYYVVRMIFSNKNLEVFEIKPRLQLFIQTMASVSVSSMGFTDLRAFNLSMLLK
ncbi:hypothetical protein MtrunA17_Chr3g0121131 [Medicago truncatula]|uniref:Transmembrane protein n=1 Tax=Medicago truncatula TaxID=3880 RepID=A0A396IYF0_MEDTR|nr:hypothetical protein MtrunA17_Chr3g0121131 [Medicago truncatula]